MPVRVDAYTSEGIASGSMETPGALRDVLEVGRRLELHEASWQPMGEPRRSVGDLAIEADEVLIAISSEDPFLSMHASWHQIRLEIGPYVVAGELPTLPGFDPGRALTRPSGEFVVLRDVQLGFLAVPGQTVSVSHAVVNRYGVDRVTADLMLGFFFPGAVMDGMATAPAGPALGS